MRALSIPDDSALAIGRGLLLGLFAAMMVSTSLGVGFEIAACIAFASVPALRRRAVAVLRHPAVAGFLALAAIIAASVFHGRASWHDALGELAGWHRALLLPLAAAVFDDSASKRLALKTLMAVCLAGAAVSFFTAAAGISITAKLTPGIVFHNYTSQGLAFAIAMTAGIAAVMQPDAFAGDAILGSRPAMAAMAWLMAADIIFILPSRSAYAAMLVMGAVITALLARGPLRLKMLASAAALTALGLLLVLSPLTRSRLAQGVHEITTVDSAAKGSSFGARAVMWRNTVKMIADHPLFGVGTGGFRDSYRTYSQDGHGWQTFETPDPHNQFMKFQAEQGVLGLAAALFFIVCVIVCPGVTPYRPLAIAVMAGWCATSLANAHFSTFVEGRLLFLWLGVFLSGKMAAPAPAS